MRQCTRQIPRLDDILRHEMFLDIKHVFFIYLEEYPLCWKRQWHNSCLSSKWNDCSDDGRRIRVLFQYPIRRLIVRSHKARSREICINNCVNALKFGRHLGRIAADVPSKYSSDAMIWINNLAASRLQDVKTASKPPLYNIISPNDNVNSIHGKTIVIFKKKHGFFCGIGACNPLFVDSTCLTYRCGWQCHQRWHITWSAKRNLIATKTFDWRVSYRDSEMMSCLRSYNLFLQTICARSVTFRYYRTARNVVLLRLKHIKHSRNTLKYSLNLQHISS